jgi:polyvinyl alcohol dehydrogenase (cytochrome)
VVSLRRSSATALLVAAVGAALLVPGPAHAAKGDAEQGASCAKARSNGGNWPSYGHDLSNTRYQRHEKVISPGDAPALGPIWSFSTTDAGGEGDITGTPAVVGGCVYTATTEGWAFAINADTGKLVWKRKLPYGGGVNGSVTVKRGRVYASIARLNKEKGCPKKDPCKGPYAVALDRKTGKVIWASRTLDTQPGSDVFGSPVIFKGRMMVGISGGAAELGDEADRYAFQGSMVFLNARNGKVVRRTWTIHAPKKPDNEFAGAGIWSTPAVDRRAQVAYAGTANPFKPQAEHEHANAVLKYDVDPNSPKFGRILDSYKGNVDEYFPGLSELPCYDFPGNEPPYYPQGIGSCGDIDLDFGAAPNLFKVDGRKLVGAGQKSGVYHVFDARTMEPVWSTIVGPPTAVGGIVGSTAYDGEAMYGPITVPGYLWSLSADGGSYRWAGAVADGIHWGNPVAVANGLVYTTDLAGFLDVYDARTGLQLGKHPLVRGTGNPESLSWAGVSVARNTVYAAVGIRGQAEGHIVAFQPGGNASPGGDGGGDGGGGGGGGDGGDGGGGGGGSGANPPIVAAPGAASTNYATPVATTGVGGPLSFTNLDLAKHDVTSEEKGPDGKPLFSTPLIDLGETAEVEGLDKVKSGQSYGFFCTIHPGMRGTLVVR